MRRLYIVFLMAACFFLSGQGGSVVAGTADGGAKVRLTGNMVQGIGDSITVGELEKAGLQVLRRHDPFEKKTLHYSGVWLDAFVERFGKAGVTAVTFTAIDEYQVTVDRQEWMKTRILLVTRVDDRYLDFEHKGPIRVVYADYDPAVHNPKEVLPKWIWMITKIDFR